MRSSFEAIATDNPDVIWSIVITDPTTYAGDSSGEDMVITIFRPRMDMLPLDLPPGTPILFRGLRVRPHFSVVDKGPPDGPVLTV